MMLVLSHVLMAVCRLTRYAVWDGLVSMFISIGYSWMDVVCGWACHILNVSTSSMEAPASYCAGCCSIFAVVS